MIRTSTRGPVNFRGIGLHTGQIASVTIHPAPTGFGLQFRTKSGTQLPALATHVTDTSRCTVLGIGEERLSTVEHILSSCVGLGITDLLIDVDGPEIPIGDGSALFWTELLRNAGLESSEAPEIETVPRLQEEILLAGPSGSFLAAYPAESFRLTVGISFPHPLVGTQVARFEPGLPSASYADDIAGARTFGFIEEVEALQAAGLALGGSFDNAIVIYDDHYSSPLRYGNELARHKLLDVLGDLALSGCSELPNADIIAVKPSHRLNVALAQRLLDLRTDTHFTEG